MRSILRRRRALMAQKEAQAETVPGRTITIPTAFTTGSDMISAVQQAVTDNAISCPAILLTTKRMSQLSEKSFMAAVIQANGSVIGGFYCHNGNILGVNDWQSSEYISAANDTYYVLETNYQGSDLIPGKKIITTTAINNGQNVSTEFHNRFLEKEITGPAIVFSAKPSSSWVSHELVCLLAENGSIIYYHGNFGPFRRLTSGTSIETKAATSTYDFKASLGSEFYTVEVLQ